MEYITKSVRETEDYIYCENGFRFSKKSAYHDSYEGWTSADACMFDVDADFIGFDEVGNRYFRYEVG